jgi:hypothetical protein
MQKLATCNIQTVNKYIYSTILPQLSAEESKRLYEKRMLGHARRINARVSEDKKYKPTDTEEEILGRAEEIEFKRKYGSDVFLVNYKYTKE